MEKVKGILGIVQILNFNTVILKNLQRKDTKLANLKVPKGENSGEYIDTITHDLNDDVLAQMQVNFN